MTLRYLMMVGRVNSIPIGWALFAVHHCEGLYHNLDPPSSEPALCLYAGGHTVAFGNPLDYKLKEGPLSKTLIRNHIYNCKVFPTIFTIQMPGYRASFSVLLLCFAADFCFPEKAKIGYMLMKLQFVMKKDS